MVRKKNLLFFLLSGLLTAGIGYGQSRTVSVGDEAPDFELRDASGKTFKLSEYRGDKPVVLEFFRSGSW